MRFEFDTKKKQESSGQTQSGASVFEEGAGNLHASRTTWMPRSDVPEQYRVIGWVGGRMYSLIFEMRPRFRRRILPLGHALEIHASGKETL